MGESAYSYSLTTFSPSGKLVQIEYALNAVTKAQTSLGIKGARRPRAIETMRALPGYRSAIARVRGGSRARSDRRARRRPPLCCRQPRMASSWPPRRRWARR